MTLEHDFIPKTKVDPPPKCRRENNVTTKQKTKSLEICIAHSFLAITPKNTEQLCWTLLPKNHSAIQDTVNGREDLPPNVLIEDTVRRQSYQREEVNHDTGEIASSHLSNKGLAFEIYKGLLKDKVQFKRIYKASV